MEDTHVDRSSVYVWEDLKSLDKARDRYDSDSSCIAPWSDNVFNLRREKLLSEYNEARSQEMSELVWSGELTDPCNPIRGELRVRVIRVSEHDAVVEKLVGPNTDGVSVWLPADDELATYAYMTALLSYHTDSLEDAR